MKILDETTTGVSIGNSLDKLDWNLPQAGLSVTIPDRDAVRGIEQYGRTFVPPIESMRGIAALIVAVYHGLFVFPINDYDPITSVPIENVAGAQALVAKTLLVVPFNGLAAVSVFFVLSGLVNGMSLDRQGQMSLRSIGKYFVRRLFRLYPVFIVSLLLICAWRAIINFHPPYPGASKWFHAYYGEPILWQEFVRNVSLSSLSINPVAWTLQVEFLVAIVFPLLYVADRSRSWICSVLTMGAFIAASSASPIRWPLEAWYCAMLFCCGLLLSRCGPTVFSAKWWTGPRSVNVLILCILGFTLSHHLLPTLNSFPPIVGPIHAICIAVAVAILVYRPASYFRLVLNARVLRLTGRISYSFYLFHFFTLYVCGLFVVRVVDQAMLHRWGLLFNFIVIIASIMITMLIAYLVTQLIERPFLTIGRRLTQS